MDFDPASVPVDVSTAPFVSASAPIEGTGFFVYGIVNRQSPETVRYVGVTWYPKERLAAHRSGRVGAAISDCRDDVQMRVLSGPYADDRDAIRLEQYLIRTMSNSDSGMCDLNIYGHLKNQKEAYEKIHAKGLVSRVRNRKELDEFLASRGVVTEKTSPGRRVPTSVSLPHAVWVETNRAAGMENMTLSEYCRAAIREKNARTFGVDDPPQLRAA